MASKAKPKKIVYSSGDVLRIKGSVIRYCVVARLPETEQRVISPSRQKALDSSEAVCVQLESGEYDIIPADRVVKVDPAEELYTIKTACGEADINDLDALVKRKGELEKTVLELEAQLSEARNSLSLVGYCGRSGNQVSLYSIPFLERMIRPDKAH